MSDPRYPEWPIIEWDDCYPTDESIEAAMDFFEKATLDFMEAAKFLVRELPKCARNCCASCEMSDTKDNFGAQVKRIEFSTGGWSGAEELVGLVESRFDLRNFWKSWHRGGHYVFEVPVDLLNRP